MIILLFISTICTLAFFLIYYLYFVSIYQKKHITFLVNNASSKTFACYFLISSYALNQLLNLTLELPYRLLILMAISLSIIDLYYFIVDPYLFSLFFQTLIVTNFFNHSMYALNINLAVAVVLCSILLTYLLPNQLGMGDIKLLISWSLFLSTQQFIWLLFFSSLLGIIYVLFYRLCSNHPLIKIAFVPFLSIGLMLTLQFFN